LISSLLLSTLVLQSCDLFGINDSIVRASYCILLLLAFVKFNFFLRIFDGFGFLVSMMLGVFSDLKYFIAFLFFVIAEFALLFTMLVPNSELY